jgi:branched-chain amino acid transport system substrate-binding protein
MSANLNIKALVAAAGIAAGAISGVSAETLGPVTDPLGVVKIPKGAPIHIGGYWTLSGPDVDIGLDQKRGAEIAMDDWDNAVAGHPIEFHAEDSHCSAEGGQTAATRLASNRNIVVVIGPDCSSAGTPGGPILWKAGIPSVATSTTAPSLTAPDRPESLQGYLRTIYNDLASGAADAEYFWNQMKCKSLATIHDGSPYAEQLVRVAKNRFMELGGKVTAMEAVAPTDVDMRPALTRIAAAKPCVVYFPIFVAAAARIVHQFGEIEGLDSTTPVGGSALMAPGFLEAAGDSAVDFVFTNPDTSPDAMGNRYPQLVEKYKEKYGEAPVQAFHQNAYDGMAVTLMGIEKVAVKDDAGNTYIGRQALRDALFATKGFDGMGGEITCNEHGDCAAFKFAAYKFTNSDPETFEIGTNPAKIHP